MTAPSVASTDAPGELPRNQERLAVAALALAAFALNLNTNVLGPLLPFVREQLALDGGRDGFLLSAAAWGSAFGALVVGPLADRFGRKTPLVAGLAVFVALSIAHVLTADYWLLLSLRAGSGFAVGVAYASASALMAELVPYWRRGAAMGVFNVGMFLAVPVGLPAAVLLARAGHWQWIFVVQAVVAVLGCGLVLRSVPQQPGWGHWVSPLAIVRRMPVAAGLLTHLLHVGSFFTTVQLASTWLHDTELVVKQDQVYVWIGLGLASAAGAFAFGRLADAIGKRTFVLATSAILAMCFVLLQRTALPWLVLVVGVVLAVTAAARTGPLQALVSGLVAPRELATLMGLRGFAMQAGVAVFALVAAPIAAGSGFHGVLLLAAGCQFVSYLAIRFGVRGMR